MEQIKHYLDQLGLNYEYTNSLNSKYQREHHIQLKYDDRNIIENISKKIGHFLIKEDKFYIYLDPQNKGKYTFVFLLAIDDPKSSYNRLNNSLSSEYEEELCQLFEAFFDSNIGSII